MHTTDTICTAYSCLFHKISAVLDTLFAQDWITNGATWDANWEVVDNFKVRAPVIIFQTSMWYIIERECRTLAHTFAILVELCAAWRNTIIITFYKRINTCLKTLIDVISIICCESTLRIIRFTQARSFVIQIWCTDGWASSSIPILWCSTGQNTCYLVNV